MSGAVVVSSQLGMGELRSEFGQGNLPPLPAQMVDISQLQEKLTDLLKVPRAQWNYETLKNSLTEIGRAVLVNDAAIEDYQIGRTLSERAQSLSAGDHNLQRALSRISTILGQSEEMFKSLFTYNGYRDEQLEARTHALYAHQVLTVLCITAPRTENLDFLSGLLKSPEIGVQYSTYCNIGCDLESECRFSILPSDSKMPTQLRTILTDALKQTVVNDIEVLAAERGLHNFEKTELLQMLENEPQKIEGRLAEMLNEHSRPMVAKPVTFASEQAEEAHSDFATFRSYAVRKVAPYVHGADKANALKTYQILKGC